METVQNAPAQPSASGPKVVIRALEVPIRRGETVLAELGYQKPSPGQCRGLKLSDLGNGDVSALIKLIPRITVPNLTEQEASEMDLADLTEAAEVVVDFLFTKARKADLPTT